MDALTHSTADAYMLLAVTFDSVTPRMPNGRHVFVVDARDALRLFIIINFICC